MLKYFIFILILQKISSLKRNKKYLKTFVKKENFLLLSHENIEVFKEYYTESFIYIHTKDENCPKCEQILKTISKFAYIYNYSEKRTFRNHFGLIICENYYMCKKEVDQDPPVFYYNFYDEKFFYRGDFSEKSLEKFINDKLVEPKVFNMEKTVVIGDDKATVIFNGERDLVNEAFELFFDLSKMERDDHFYYCKNNQDCKNLFKNEDNKKYNVLFVKKNKSKFLEIDKFWELVDLKYEFNEFKTNFIIEIEDRDFENFVFEEGNKVLFLIMKEKDEEQRKEFIAQTKKYHNKIRICILIKNKLKDSKRFKKLEKILGIKHTVSFPVITFLQKDENKKYLQFRHSTNDLNNVDGFTRYVLLGKITPFKKSLEFHLHFEGSFKIINYRMFEEYIFVQDQETILFVHNDLKEDILTGEEMCEESKKYLEKFEEIYKQERFKHFKFYIIHGGHNDMHFYLHKQPAFVIFTKDFWEKPITFYKSSEFLDEIYDVLDNRYSIIDKINKKEKEEDDVKKAMDEEFEDL